MYATQNPVASAKRAGDVMPPAAGRQHRKAQPARKTPAAVMDAIETRVHSAKRSARKKLFAVEDLLDMAVIQLRRRPLRSLGMALAAGVAIGVVAGRAAFSRPCRD